MRPLAATGSSPVEGHLTSRACVNRESSRLRAGATIDVAVACALYRILAEDVSDGTWIGGATDAVALDEIAVDGHVLQDAVCRDEGDGSGEGEKEGGGGGLHFE